MLTQPQTKQLIHRYRTVLDAVGGLVGRIDGHQQAVEIQQSFLRRHLLDGSQASAPPASASCAPAR